tara:strand:+ start:45 stop:317 length:273 start_codon:yes stop_codon:yes gene_type:complete
MCTATASRITGTIQHEVSRKSEHDKEDIIVMHGSGFIDINASVYQKNDGEWFVEQTSAYRTQRRLFDGKVYVSASSVPSSAKVKIPNAAE